MRYIPRLIGIVFFGLVVGCSGGDSKTQQNEKSSPDIDTSVDSETRANDVFDVERDDARDTETTNDSTEKTSEYKIKVGTQKVKLVNGEPREAGSIEVELVSTGEKPVWVSVRKTRENSGKLGDVIGHSDLVESQTRRSNFRVSLNEGRDIKPGREYQLVLHKDEPADGEFKFANGDGGASIGGNAGSGESVDSEVEDPPLRIDGSLQSVSFDVETQHDSMPGYTLDVQDQPRRSPYSVVVNSVKTGKEPAWLAIWRGESSGPTELLGHSKLISSDSKKTDLEISLDEGSIESFNRPMYASLHLDEPADETFSRGEPLVFKAGKPLVREFQIEEKSSEDYLVMTDTVVPSYNRKSLSIFAVDTRQQEVWVAVHEDSQSTRPGEVIGFSNKIGADTLKYDVEIPLFRPVEDGEALEVILHRDNPADGLFTYNDDRSEDPPLMEEETPVSAGFQVSVKDEYSLVVNEQVIPENENQIAIDEVRTGKSDAWIVVSDARQNLDEEDVLGAKFIERRSKHQLLPLSLNKKPEEGETLYAHLYRDKPNDGSFSLTGNDADQPILKNNRKILEGFNIRRPASN